MCRCGSARLLACPCQGQAEVKSFAALDLGNDAVAPELAYVTARYAALAPFGKVAALLSELLPISGAQNAGTVRNRTLRVGENVVQRHATETAKPTATPPADPVVVGLDGGYVRSRHRQEGRHFEVIAGKVIDADGTQHRFAFARNGQTTSAEAFAQALAAAGVHADTPATVLCDGDAGLWRHFSCRVRRINGRIVATGQCYGRRGRTALSWTPGGTELRRSRGGGHRRGHRSEVGVLEPVGIDRLTRCRREANDHGAGMRVA